MAELISVVVPAYNAERYIGGTLASVSSQTYGNLEIVVVDDGSTDGTRDVVRAHALNDPRVVLLEQANGGVAAARNAGIARARGDLVAPVDADDLWHPVKLERQAARLAEAGPDVGLVYVGHLVIDEASRVLRVPFRDAVHEGDVLLRLIVGNIVGNASTPLIPKSRLLEAGGYDERLRAAGAEGCEDLKLYLALAHRHTFAAVPSNLVGYRRTTANMSLDVRRMLRSQAFVLDDLRQRAGYVPPALWRWAEASICSWLTGLVWRSPRGRTEACRLMAGMFRIDPLAAADMLARWLAARLAAGPGAGEWDRLVGRDYRGLEAGELQGWRIDDGWLPARRLRFLARHRPSRLPGGAAIGALAERLTALPVAPRGTPLGLGAA